MTTTARSDDHRGRRRATVAALSLLPLIAFAGVELGARAGVDAALAAARESLAAGNYGTAVANDAAVANSGGPLYLLSHPSIQSASATTQAAELAWASALAKDSPDQALALLNAVTDPALAAQVETARSNILLGAAKQASAAGRSTEALNRIVALGVAHGPAAAVAEAKALRPGYEVAAAQQLVGANRAADAVALLDDVIAQAKGPPVAAAMAELPAALLAAGQQSITAQANAEAAVFFLRLINDDGSTDAAQQAQQLLNAPQIVTGTLAHRDGSPISGQVRLASGFRQFAHGYVTSGPFYYGAADANGDFIFTDIPVGGPYYLEVNSAGSWTTLIDPNTGVAANPVTVVALTPSDLAFIVLPD